MLKKASSKIKNNAQKNDIKIRDQQKQKQKNNDAERKTRIQRPVMFETAPMKTDERPITMSNVDLRCRYWIDQRLAQLLMNDNFTSKGEYSLKINNGEFQFTRNNGTIVRIDSEGNIYSQNIFISGVNVLLAIRELQRIMGITDDLDTIYVKHVQLKDGTYEMNIKDIITDTATINNLLTVASLVASDINTDSLVVNNSAEISKYLNVFDGTSGIRTLIKFGYDGVGRNYGFLKHSFSSNDSAFNYAIIGLNNGDSLEFHNNYATMNTTSFYVPGTFYQLKSSMVAGNILSHIIGQSSTNSGRLSYYLKNPITDSYLDIGYSSYPSFKMFYDKVETLLNMTCDGNLSVIGTTTTKGISNTGNITSTGNLAINGNILVNGEIYAQTRLSTDGSLVVRTDITADGNIHAGAQLSGSSLLVLNNSSLSGNLSVNGETTLGDSTSDRTNINGVLRINFPASNGFPIVCKTTDTLNNQAVRITIEDGASTQAGIGLWGQSGSYNAYFKILGSGNATLEAYTNKIQVGSGPLVINNQNLQIDNGNYHQTYSTNTTWNAPFDILDPNMTGGRNLGLAIGKANSTNNRAEIYYHHDSDGSNNNYMMFGLYGNTAGKVYGNKSLSYDGAATFNNTLFIESTNSNPQNLFHISAPNLTGTNWVGFYVGVSPNTNNSGHMWFYWNSTDTARKFRFGYWGGQSIDVFKNKIESTTSISNVSDARLKENLKELDDEHCAQIIENVKLYQFNFINDDTKTLHYGLLAQDLMKYDKILITESNYTPTDEDNEELSKKSGLKKDDKYYGITYTELIPILINYCQGLKRKNDEATREINELKDIISKQQDMIDELRTNIKSLFEMINQK